MKLKRLIVILIVAAICYSILLSQLAPEEKIVIKFSSEEDFKAYLEEAAEVAPLFAAMAPTAARAMEEAAEETKVEMALIYTAERISPTTVQVREIDEPDLVKTDGSKIYFSPKTAIYFPRERGIVAKEVKTKIIRAFPPETLSVLSELDETGDLFLTTDTLLVLADKIYGYDIAKPELPTKKFTLELNGSIAGARLYKGKVYVVLKDRTNYYKPCPIYPLAINGKPFLVACREIYHPIQVIPTDVTYTTLILDPETGEVENSLSFAGSSSSVVYMSKQAIYITYTYNEDMFKMILGSIEEKCGDIIPSYIVDKLKEIEGYDISTTSKMMEFQLIMEEWTRSLSQEESLRIGNEFQNRMMEYFEEKKRDFIKTGIIKIGLEDFSILATGEIPGMPLNQFSLDEYGDYLRIATTVGMGWGTSQESENDVYILSKNLEIVGLVKGLGIEERIYSVRFLGERGYIVTFREIDPFYVLDLSDPTNPEVKGELKIPGYSSYLHPIEENLILGIGKEGPKVKISLFDVSSAEEPKEIDKYTLDEFWSDVLETHHAFLLDKKHGIFFLPGTKGGYIFSYSNQKLELIKAIPAYGARRAIYLDDWLYILADSMMVVLDENTWEKVNELEYEVEGGEKEEEEKEEEKLLPEKCVIPTGTGLSCDESLVSADAIADTIKIKIKNSLANAVTITAIGISPICGAETTYITDNTIASDASTDFTVTCTGLEAGKLKGDLTIKYEVEGLARTTTGGIITAAV